MNKNKSKFMFSVKAFSVIMIVVVFIYFIGFFYFIFFQDDLIKQNKIVYFIAQLFVIVGPAIVSIFGISLLVDLTNIHNITKEICEDASKLFTAAANKSFNDYLSKTCQVDYLTENYSRDELRRLLYKIYYNKSGLSTDLNDEYLCTIKSFEKYIEYLTTAIYLKKDDQTTIIEIDEEKQIIKKTITRNILLINNHQKDNVYRHNIYYTKVEGNEGFNVEYFLINEKDSFNGKDFKDS